MGLLNKEEALSGCKETADRLARENNRVYYVYELGYSYFISCAKNDLKIVYTTK